MEGEPPAQAPALEDPVGFEALGDDLVRTAFLRALFVTHGTLHVVCRRLKALLRSPEFLQQRVETGLAEHGLVFAGGYGLNDRMANCYMLKQRLRRHERHHLLQEWRRISPLSGPRDEACSAIVKDEDGQHEMWVMGGADDEHILATVEAYSPRTNTWRLCRPLSEGRRGAVAGVVGGRLVVAGGSAIGADALTSVEAYTPTGWTPLPPLPHAADSATACVLNGRLYVMGGHGCNKLQVLEMSEEHGFSWSVKADLPAYRYHAASAVVDGKLWVMGGVAYHAEDEDEDEGDRRTASVLVYDTASDTWATGMPLAHPMQNSCAAVHDGELWLKTYADMHVHRNGAWVESADRRAYVENADTAIEDTTCQSVLLG